MIPVNLKSMFRVIALMEPDLEIILRTKCIQFGIKAPSIVANRLNTLYELCQTSMISLQSKYQLTVSTFLSVLQTIYGKKRLDTAATLDSRPTSNTGGGLPQQHASSASNNKYGSTKIECKINLYSCLIFILFKNYENNEYKL